MHETTFFNHSVTQILSSCAEPPDAYYAAHTLPAAMKCYRRTGSEALPASLCPVFCSIFRGGERSPKPAEALRIGRGCGAALGSQREASTGDTAEGI